MNDIKKIGLLGEGAYAKVYLAEDSNGIQFALKEYPRDSKNEEELRIYFKAEASIYEKELSNNVVKLYDMWEEEKKLCLLFEYCEYGCMKHQLKEKGRFDLRRTLKAGISVLNALESLHKEGIIHRDIKPHNILQGRKGVLKLADLGLAKVEGNKELKHARGSVAYISPEQYRDYNNVDERSDIYSLGATLFQLYTGKELYTGKDLDDILDSHQNCIVPNLREIRSDCPLSFNHALRKMVAKKPADRYQTAAEARKDLEKIFKGSETIHELPSIQDFKEKVDEDSRKLNPPNEKSIDSPNMEDLLKEELRQKKLMIMTLVLSVVIVLGLIFFKN